MNAQDPKAVEGEYYLHGVMETASGFKLNSDHSFEFFFSYGALDRSGKGTWERKQNKLIFNSPVPSEQPFQLVTHKSVPGAPVTIKILEDNPSFQSGVYAIIREGNSQSEDRSKAGIITFPKQRVDSIVLLFEFCPEKTAVFAFNNRDENYFEFKLSPTIMDVDFEDVVFSLDAEGFGGQHPLLKEGDYHFRKAK